MCKITEIFCVAYNLKQVNQCSGRYLHSKAFIFILITLSANIEDMSIEFKC